MTHAEFTKRLQAGLRPPASALRITTIDMHTGGEPLRVFTGGLPEIEGETVLEKRRYLSRALRPHPHRH